MNDYEYTFYQDIKEKKRTATGAYHKATRGKRSFTVHNQSDHLTPKQRKELSSPVTTFNDAPITYTELLAMDQIRQYKYLKFIIEKYNVSCYKLADMLGCSKQSIYKLMKKINLVDGKKRFHTQKQKIAWEQFLGRNKSAAEPIEITESEEPTIPEEETIIPKPITEEAPIIETAAFNSINYIALSGADKDRLSDEIKRALTFVLPDHRTYKITIEAL